MLLTFFAIAETMSPYVMTLLVITALGLGFLAGSITQIIITDRENHEDYKPKHLAKRGLVLRW